MKGVPGASLRASSIDRTRTGARRGAAAGGRDGSTGSVGVRAGGSVEAGTEGMPPPIRPEINPFTGSKLL
jgi:hypothetical protein